MVDSQSVKTTESGGIRGFDAGKKVKGRKRHIITDTGGLLVGVKVHATDIQDRDGAPPLLESIQHTYPKLRHIFADGAYAGPKFAAALAKLGSLLSDQEKEEIALMALKVIAADGRREVAEMEQFNTAIEAAGISPVIVHRAFDRYFSETMPGD